MIGVPVRIKRPKEVSRYTILDYEVKDTDETLHYIQYFRFVYKNKLEWSDISGRADIILVDKVFLFCGIK